MGQRGRALLAAREAGLEIAVGYGVRAGISARPARSNRTCGTTAYGSRPVSPKWAELNNNTLAHVAAPLGKSLLTSTDDDGLIEQSSIRITIPPIGRITRTPARTCLAHLRLLPHRIISWPLPGRLRSLCHRLPGVPPQGGIAPVSGGLIATMDHSDFSPRHDHRLLSLSRWPPGTAWSRGLNEISLGHALIRSHRASGQLPDGLSV